MKWTGKRPQFHVTSGLLGTDRLIFSTARKNRLVTTFTASTCPVEPPRILTVFTEFEDLVIPANL